MATIYHHAPEGTDAKVIAVPGFPERAIVRYYDHMYNLQFLPANPQLGIDAQHMLNELDIIENQDVKERFVHQYSYPLETAQRMADEINSK